ncbi:hypothetical protein AB0A95_30720 [Micromonospora sp. NPDC049230]|uniref:hypothetical protein n=1 Tax=Micromonospora sp. NPDC049230 TaxID=3155502 RepID=UPI00340F3E4C
MRVAPAIARAAFVCGLAGAAWCAFATLDPDTARADDRPAAIAEQSEGLLGDVLDQTSDAVGDVVDQVLPAKPAEPDPERPADDPSGGSSAEPESKPDPVGHILDGVTGTVGEVVDSVGTVVEVITTPPPVVVPPVVVTPAPATSTPAPTTTTAGTGTTQSGTEAATVPAPAAAEPVPADLPVPIGPAVGRTLDDPSPAAYPVDHHAGEVRQCDGTPRSLDELRRTIREGADIHTAPRLDRTATRDDWPCPSGPAGPVAQAGGMTAVAGSSPQHGDQVSGEGVAQLTWPTLHRLYALRARGDLPVSRSTHLDPRPA